MLHVSGARPPPSRKQRLSVRLEAVSPTGTAPAILLHYYTTACLPARLPTIYKKARPYFSMHMVPRRRGGGGEAVEEKYSAPNNGLPKKMDSCKK